jgi:hypothetical protein
MPIALTSRRTRGMQVDDFERLLGSHIRDQCVRMPYDLIQQMFPELGIRGALSWGACRGFAVEDDQAMRQVIFLRPWAARAVPA